ncbi:MarR family winged helix-turn-helix transcriptional regulator [Gordonia sp. NPDC003425]
MSQTPVGPSPSGPRGPRASAGFWLHHAALAWRAAVDAALRDAGLTMTQFTILASANFLAAQSESPTQQDVADMAGADRMMTSKVLRTLEGRHLVRREPAPGDARSNRIVVTPAGSELVHRSVRTVAEVDARFFGSDRDDMRGRLRELTERARVPDDRGPVTHTG